MSGPGATVAGAAAAGVAACCAHDAGTLAASAKRPIRNGMVLLMLMFILHSLRRVPGLTCDRSRPARRQGLRPLPATRVQLRRTLIKKQAIEPALAEQLVQFAERDVDQEQNKQPDLDGRESVPREIGHRLGERLSVDPVLDALLDQPGEKHEYAIDRGLEE